MEDFGSTPWGQRPQHGAEDRDAGEQDKHGCAQPVFDYKDKDGYLSASGVRTHRFQNICPKRMNLVRV